MDISRVMTRRPIMLHECATVLDAVEKMRGVGCGFLPIGDEKHVVGVITDRDILVRAVALNKDLSKLPITDIMSRNVIVCNEDDILQCALYLMNKHGIRRILVRDKNQHLSGVLSMGDVLRRIPDPLELTDLLYKPASQCHEEELV
ncbi:MAG TPA: CBS domain-containing protein [Gammaproteobacteria bacterium]|nr:CBS domain-containing protein [Gammaproteobacteria bacterium]